MTAPTGYIRARVERERDIDRIWASLRRARKPVSAATLAERAKTSRSQVKRLLQAARDAGWLAAVSYDLEPGPDFGAARVPLYALTSAAPAAAPVLVRDGSGYLAQAAGRTPGAALAELRSARGWTLTETAQEIGVRDKRTVRRYEAMATLPPSIADRVDELAAEG